jgi:Zn-dependent M28 family amino/carboxypeptidase
VHAPLVRLDRMAAVINLDAGAPPARVWSWRIAGGEHHGLGELARDVAAARGWTATTSPATPNTDYFPFARLGVPAVFIVPGPAPYEGLSADSTAGLRRRWDRYHQPGDEWHAAFPFEGLARYAAFALLLGLAVDGAGGR